MRRRSTVFMLGVSLVLAGGCDKPAEPAAKIDVEVRPAEPEPLPEVDTAAPPEPEPPPELEPEPSAKLQGPSAGEGFELGAKPKSRANRGEIAKPLRHGGAIVSVTPDVDDPSEDEEGEYRLHIQVRVEFDGADSTLGLNHVRAVEGRWCDVLRADLQEIARLEDGRWLVDAQLACQLGEDYFSADNAHTLILVNPAAQTAAVLWTGSDSGSNAMDVCVSSSVSSFELLDDQLIIRRTEVTELDRQAAKELKEAAEGCKPKRETTKVAARISLARCE
jgi:hypothetical protein